MQNWLIIGGTSRSGTTAVFRYLRDHPAICAATLKETGYFLGEDHALTRLHRYSESLAGYADLFPCESVDQVMMEATPQYLYSDGTAERIYKANPQAKIIFLLREPISRLVSWHRFGRQKGFLLTQMSFAKFVDAQHEQLTVDTPFPLRAMVEGRYARYLRCWLDVFPRESMMVVKYSDLNCDPRSTLRQIATFAGVDAGFYDGYQFEVFNASYEARSALVGKVYHAFEWRLRWFSRNSPLRKHIRDFESRVVRRMFKRLNTKPEQKTVIPDNVQARLEAYYRDEPRELAEVLGIETWEW